MTRTSALLWGVAIASASVLLVLTPWQPLTQEKEIKQWRERAYEAEHQLALLRSRLESVSAQLESVSTRLDALPSPTAGVACSTPTQTTLPPDPSPSSIIPPDLTLSDLTRREEWDALVAGTLQAEVHRRLGRTLSPEQEQRLVGILARLRDASLELGEETVDPEDPLSLSAHLMRTIVLLEADRSFRNELGISVSDFLQGLNEDQIEEVSPVESASKPGS